MLHQPSADAPVLVDRPTFARLVETAKRCAENPALAADLVDIVQTLEAQRHSVEWDEEDAKVRPGTFLGDEHQYYRFLDGKPIGPSGPNMPKFKVLWRSEHGEIFVADRPVSADQMNRLEALGIAAPLERFFVQMPYRAVSVRDPRHMGLVWTPPLEVVKSPEPPGGAWLVAGPARRPFAWFSNGADADYAAASLNMVETLSKEISRFGRGGTLLPQEIAKNGFLGLIRWLRWSIEASERWEAEPPQALRTLGIELEKNLAAFLEGREAFHTSRSTAT
jgi:hypothetical protein